MRIKLRHLEVFNALFEAGSVSRAAERLNLSQPAVSIALGNLEAELGFRLFHRDRGFFAPTNEALLLHEDVQQGINALSRIDRQAAEISSGAAGRITVATNGVVAFNLLPGLIAAFRKDFPGTLVDIHVRSSRQIATLVHNRQIDIGFIDVPVPVSGLHAEKYPMECVCIFRADDDLAKFRQVSPENLRNRNVIAVTGDHSVDHQLRRVMSDADQTLEQHVSSSYFAIARNLVAAGTSVAIVDPINGKAPLNDNVTWRPFTPRIVHELAVVTSQGKPLGLVASKFRERVRDRLSRYVAAE